MERAFNLNEVAELLGMQVRTVRYWVRIGKISAKKVVGSRRWIVMESEIKRLRGEQNGYED